MPFCRGTECFEKPSDPHPEIIVGAIILFRLRRPGNGRRPRDDAALGGAGMQGISPANRKDSAATYCQ
jgi:hypothetical protein